MVREPSPLSTDPLISVFAQLGIQANIIGKFHSNPSSSFRRDAITRKIKDGRRRPCVSTDRNSVFVFAQLDTKGNILTKFLRNIQLVILDEMR